MHTLSVQSEVLFCLVPTMVPALSNDSATGNAVSPGLVREPLQYSGSLNHLESFDVTPVIGKEFCNVQLTDLLRSDNADVLLRDLAILSELALLHDENLANSMPLHA